MAPAPNGSSSEDGAVARSGLRSVPPRPSPERRTPKDDLDFARRLSRSLNHQERAAPSPTSATPGPVGPFSRFGVAPHAPRPLGIGAEGWRTLLAEVVQLTHASSAFALDESGLLVAATGVEKDEAEGLGSRLIVAFEHVDRAVNQPGRSITIDLGPYSLTAFRGGAGAGSTFTLILRSQSALPDATRAAVVGLLQPVQHGSAK